MSNGGMEEVAPYAPLGSRKEQLQNGETLQEAIVRIFGECSVFAEDCNDVFSEYHQIGIAVIDGIKKAVFRFDGFVDCYGDYFDTREEAIESARSIYCDYCASDEFKDNKCFVEDYRFFVEWFAPFIIEEYKEGVHTFFLKEMQDAFIDAPQISLDDPSLAAQEWVSWYETNINLVKS
jgi:hypothetical protein